MTEGSPVRICALCQHENPGSALFCQHCGAPFPTASTTTISVPDELAQTLEIGPAHAPSSRMGLGEGSIALHVAGQPQPIIIREKREIVLGRRVVGEPPPAVDLTDFHAHLLGVSRKHALIRFTGNRPFLIDLNSQNGTWINEQRLQPDTPHPLRHGDQVRLGQLIFFVYLPRPKTVPDSSKPSNGGKPSDGSKPSDNSNPSDGGKPSESSTSPDSGKPSDGSKPPDSSK